MTTYQSDESKLRDNAQDERMDALSRAISDMQQRFDTLQTPLWKRVLFRIDGWPGQSNLNAERPRWRPWRRWWTS